MCRLLRHGEVRAARSKSEREFTMLPAAPKSNTAHQSCFAGRVTACQ